MSAARLSPAEHRVLLRDAARRLLEDTTPDTAAIHPDTIARQLLNETRTTP